MKYAIRELEAFSVIGQGVELTNSSFMWWEQFFEKGVLEKAIQT